MDPDSLQRSAEEDDRQITYWNEQIAIEQKMSATRIENFRAEIEKHQTQKKEKLEKAKQLIIEAQKNKENLEKAAAAAVTRRIL